MVASAIAAAATVAGSVISSKGSKSAASAQSAGISEQIAFQREVFQQGRADLAPFREIGVSALQDIADLFGLARPSTTAEINVPSYGEWLAANPQFHGKGAAVAARARQAYEQEVTRQSLPQLQGEINRVSLLAAQNGLPTYNQFLRDNPSAGGGGVEGVQRAFAAYQASIPQLGDLDRGSRQQNALSKFKGFPGFGFRLEQGQQAQDRSAAARGLLLSGRQVKETERFAQGEASQEFNNFLTRLFGIAGVGSNATNATVQAGQNASSQIGNALAEQGASRASGIAGSTNALTEGIAGVGEAVGFGIGSRSGAQTPPIVPPGTANRFRFNQFGGF